MSLRDHYDRILRMKDGGGLPAQVNFQQRPEGPSYAQPYIDQAQKFDQQYPVVGQLAQLASQPVNVAAGIYGMGKAAMEHDAGGVAANALSMVPLAGRYAKAAVLAGTARSARQLQQVSSMGMRPSADMLGTAARRIGGDAGTLTQAGQLGVAAYDQSNALRNGAP